MIGRNMVTVLLAANIGLAASLVWRATSNTAQAQPAPTPPGTVQRGNYLLIPGFSQSLNASIIYVFDSTPNNHRLGGLAPDSNYQLTYMPMLPIDSIFNAADQSPAVRTLPRGRPGTR